MADDEDEERRRRNAEALLTAAAESASLSDTDRSELADLRAKSVLTISQKHQLRWLLGKAAGIED